MCMREWSGVRVEERDWHGREVWYLDFIYYFYLFLCLVCISTCAYFIHLIFFIDLWHIATIALTNDE